MKQLILTVFLITCTIGLYAQNATINRLQLRLRTSANDAVRLSVLDSLSMYNMFFNHKPDSTFYYCNEYINKAFQTGDKKHLVLAYARLSFYYNNTGLYKECLGTALKGLDLSEQYHINDYLSALYYDLCWAYNNLDQSTEALSNGLKGLAHLKQNKDPFFDQALHLYGIVGYNYTIKGKLDSAVYYYKKMDSVEATSKEPGAKAITDWYWSLYYLYNTRQYSKADSVISDAINECLKSGDFLLNFFYIFSSRSCLIQHKTVLAIVQARKAFKLSISINDVAGQNSAAAILNECYEKLKKPDSAYYYLKLTDSLGGITQTHSNAMDVLQQRFDRQLTQKEKAAANEIQQQRSRTQALVYVFITALAFVLTILIIQLRNSKQKRKANEILRQQKEKVESTLSELKSTQAQLVQREKMASLGELTAGIAHEIQNPLNFVNNFSDVNREMLDELQEQLNKGDVEEARAIATDIRENELKINHHGKRAEGIVKGMLEHSRATTGQKEFTDLNMLADEYLRLAYNGLRAKDKSFNAELITNFDKKLSKVNVIPQDMGRVLLNLFNNAFYAVNQKMKTAAPGYKPVVELSTAALNGYIEIKVKDNGTGIPDAIKDKIMQPFFTTKPTGQGTGLGLSLAYDIVTKEHGGTIEAQSLEGEGSSFIIRLPAT